MLDPLSAGEPTNPYEELEASAFWKTAVADRDPMTIQDLWRPKSQICKGDLVATAGSCFAQHISRALVRNEFNWMDGEPAPSDMSADAARALNYGVFSFRTGNIYTAETLLQWVNWSLRPEDASAECWEKDGRYYDPFRPAIQPGGFSSMEELLRDRAQTLQALKKVFATADVFVFTMGLTEAWRNKRTGVTYAMCPGTVAGTFNPAEHEFVNFTASQVGNSLTRAFDRIKAINPAIRFLLTVSPVPLTATASAEHVLVATCLSKSVLRCVAGETAASREDTDYFPSFEIISSVPFRGRFFDSNLRTVSSQGVDFVMRSFFAGLSATALLPERTASAATEEDDIAAILGDLDSEDDDVEDGVVCEEEMLKAFAPKS